VRSSGCLNREREKNMTREQEIREQLEATKHLRLGTDPNVCDTKKPLRGHEDHLLADWLSHRWHCDEPQRGEVCSCGLALALELEKLQRK
jgi:hypothetical protein